jgi:hypothetical protein
VEMLTSFWVRKFSGTVVDVVISLKTSIWLNTFLPKSNYEGSEYVHRN